MSPINIGANFEGQLQSMLVLDQFFDELVHTDAICFCFEISDNTVTKYGFCDCLYVVDIR